LSYRFPLSPARVLPTRLGNVIHSFEDYSYREYGIAAVAFWPRLVAVISKEYAAVIDDAKASFDFMLNSSLLSYGLALLTLAAGLVFGVPSATPATALAWLGQVVVFALLGWLFYRFSVGQAAGWGEAVRAAFDLFRGDLLDKIGYHKLPTTRA